MSDLDNAKRTVERAAAEYARQTANMERYTAEAQAEQRKKALPPLQEAVSYALEQTKAVEAEARQLAALAHADPLAGLSTEELQRMAAAAQFVQADIAALSTDELAQRLAGVLHHGDKVTKLLYLRYVNVNPEGNQHILKTLDAIQSSVNGKEKEKAEKAAQQAATMRKEAGELNYFASKTLADADGSTAIAERERMKRYVAF